MLVFLFTDNPSDSTNKEIRTEYSMCVDCSQQTRHGVMLRTPTTSQTTAPRLLKPPKALFPQTDHTFRNSTEGERSGRKSFSGGTRKRQNNARSLGCHQNKVLTVKTDGMCLE
jgi:hypothetical protein